MISRARSDLSIADSSQSKIKLYNQSILQKQKLNPFQSHDIAVEVLNKPQSKMAHLKNARSLKPYFNPNRSDSVDV